MEPERSDATKGEKEYSIEFPLLPFIISPPDRGGFAGKRLYTELEYGIMVTPEWTKLKTRESSDAWRDALCKKVEALVGDQYVAPYRFFFGCALVMSTHQALQALVPDEGDSVKLWHPPSFIKVPSISSDINTTISSTTSSPIDARAAFSSLFLPVGHVG